MILNTGKVSEVTIMLDNHVESVNLCFSSKVKLIGAEIGKNNRFRDARNLIDRNYTSEKALEKLPINLGIFAPFASS